jgi:hypothetical protein
MNHFISGKTLDTWLRPSNQIVQILSKATGISLVVYYFKWLLSKLEGSTDCKGLGGLVLFELV